MSSASLRLLLTQSSRAEKRSTLPGAPSSSNPTLSVLHTPCHTAPSTTSRNDRAQNRNINNDTPVHGIHRNINHRLAALHVGATITLVYVSFRFAPVNPWDNPSASPKTSTCTIL